MLKEEKGNEMIDQSKSLTEQFFTFAIPATISMILTSLINVVDALFIGRYIGEQAIAGISLATPIFMLFLGLTLMLSVGGSVKASHALGAKNIAQARDDFNQCFVTVAIVMFFLLVILILFLDPIINFLASGKSVGNLTKQAACIMRFFYPIMMLNITFNVFLQIQGKPHIPLFFGLAGNLLNVILDYLFIVKFNFGIKGAAFASGISVLLPFCMNLSLYLSNKNALHFHKFTFNKEKLFESIWNGSSELIGNFSVAISFFLINTILLKYSGTSNVAAYVILIHILNLQGMIITGFTIGLAPLVGYYYGAKQKEKIIGVYGVSVKSGIIVGIFTWITIMLFHSFLAEMFSPGSKTVLGLAETYYTITTVACLFNGFNLLTSTCFTAMGKPKESFAISILRSVVIYLLLAAVLPRFLKGDSVWYFYPTAEIVTVFVSAILFTKYWNKIK